MIKCDEDQRTILQYVIPFQKYNQHIQDLEEEMEEATKAAEVIRKDIQTFRSRFVARKP